MAQTMACADCGEINPAEARFCIGCGESLALQAATGPTTKLQSTVCPVCGSATPVNATFCPTCGHSTKPETASQQPQATPPPVAAPPRPVYPPPQPRVYPRVNVPPTYVPRPTQRGPQSGNAAYLPLIVFMALIFVFSNFISVRWGWPLFFLFLPLGMFGRSFRGYGSLRNYAPAFWIIGLLFLIITNTFFPGILLLWLIWAILR